MALAAEFKRASPSKGDIAVHLDAGEQAQKYASAGANIISVLTEPRYFKGGLDDMTAVRLQTTNQSYPRPAVLRKEFTTSKYQLTEAIAAGADTILLIVAVLPQHLVKELIDHARSLQMEPLVEVRLLFALLCLFRDDIPICYFDSYLTLPNLTLPYLTFSFQVHADSELEVALQAGAKVIGVNNRNLHSFQMDLQNTERIAELLTKQGCVFNHNDPSSNYTICSLSGMSTKFDVNRYRKINVGMCLIGESLMRAADPSAAIASLCLDPKEFASSTGLAGGAYTAGTKIIKVCGVTNAEDAKVACQSGANLIGVIFVPKSKRCVTPEQAKSVVDAVRSFGERTDRLTLEADKQESPLNQLVANSHELENAAKRPLVVGVFQNQSPEFIREMVQESGLDLVQLHGSEGMMAANPDQCGGVPAIRVVDIETDPETGKATVDAAETLLKSITTDPVAILLDTSIKGSKAGGGTGVTFDWGIAEKVQNAGLPVIIAGGLTPDNIGDAVTTTRPWGVDVSSGVEATPGTKDHEKVKKFVGGARKAAIEASKGF